MVTPTFSLLPKSPCVQLSHSRWSPCAASEFTQKKSLLYLDTGWCCFRPLCLTLQSTDIVVFLSFTCFFLCCSELCTLGHRHSILCKQTIQMPYVIYPNNTLDLEQAPLIHPRNSGQWGKLPFDRMIQLCSKKYALFFSA